MYPKNGLKWCNIAEIGGYVLIFLLLLIIVIQFVRFYLFAVYLLIHFDLIIIIVCILIRFPFFIEFTIVVTSIYNFYLLSYILSELIIIENDVSSRDHDLHFGPIKSQNLY